MRFRALLIGAVVAAAGAGQVTAVDGGAAAVVHHPRIVERGTSPTVQTGWASSNWSGYAVTGTTGAFNSATAQWVVPSVAPSRGATYSSAWVGIDGFNNSSLIQTGTESDYYNGSAHYYAWWEILPAAETRISMSVSPGDTMTASITNLGGGQWNIQINDVSRSETFSINQAYSGAQTSVEWIEEAPSIGGHVATLAKFSTDTFDPGTVNGVSPALTAAESGVMIQKNRQVSTPSTPDGDGDGFNVAYGATAPAPPGS